MRTIARPLALLIIAAFLLPVSSYQAAARTPAERTDSIIDYCCDLGSSFAQDPEDLIRNSAFGNWEGNSDHGMLISSRLAAAVHCAEMRRLGLEPDRDALKKIIEERITNVVLMEPVSDLVPGCIDSAAIRLDDGVTLGPLNIYCDRYAQPDKGWIENRTYWHRVLMEFPDPPSGRSSGKLIIKRNGQIRELSIEFSFPQKPAHQETSIRTATELATDTWDRIKTWCQFKTNEYKGIQLDQPSMKNIDVDQEMIRMGREVIYNIGYDESAIAAVLLDSVNYAFSSEMLELKTQTLEGVKLMTSVIGAIGGVVGIIYLDGQTGGEIFTPSMTLEEALGLLFLSGAGGMYLLSGPSRIALHYLPERPELDINGATLSRMILLGYDPWGYVMALDRISRYGDPKYIYGDESWASSASIERQLDIIDCMSYMLVSTDSYWQSVTLNKWSLANDLVRLKILKLDTESLSLQRSGEEHILRPAKFKTILESADVVEAPYIIIKYHEGLRMLNHEMWRCDMRLATMEKNI